MFRRCTECQVCKAKDQTIALLADVVDWHRAQQGVSMQSSTQALQPVFAPSAQSDEKMWLSEDEEDITSALEAGEIDVQAAEKALAALQAANTTVEIQR